MAKNSEFSNIYSGCGNHTDQRFHTPTIMGCGASAENSAARLIADAAIDFYPTETNMRGNKDAFAATGRLGQLFVHYDRDEDEVSPEF